MQPENMCMSKLCVRKAIIDKRINYYEVGQQGKDFTTKNNLMLMTINES